MYKREPPKVNKTRRKVRTSKIERAGGAYREAHIHDISYQLQPRHTSDDTLCYQELNN